MENTTISPSMRAANILCKAVELGWEWNDGLDEPFYNVELGHLVDATRKFLRDKALHGDVPFEEAPCQLSPDHDNPAYLIARWRDGYGHIERIFFYNSDITRQLSGPPGTRIYHTTAVDSRG